MELLRYAAITAAASLMLVALFPVRRLLLELPAGHMRRSWHWLGGLLLVMIGSCITYDFGWHTQTPLAEELLVPAMLLVGGWFVLLVSMLSADTIQDMRRLAVLEEETITDPLTGIFNRRYLDRKLVSEIERAKRHKLPMALMLIDVDHFKLINDRYGHAAGDLALATLAQCIRNLSRSNDIVARYGGEEIAVIVPATQLAQARIQADRLRQSIAVTQIALGEAGGGAVISAQVSIGVSVLLEADEDQSGALWARVDAGLYQAKHQGRNQVVAIPGTGNARVTDMETWIKTKKPSQAA